MNCAICGEFEPNDWRLLTLRRVKGGEEVQLLDPEDSSPELALLVHSDCLDEAVSECVVEIEDELPTIMFEGVRDCDVCSCSVLEGETFVRSSVGTLRMGNRGIPQFKVQVEHEGTLCLSCCHLIARESGVLELESVNHDGECNRCAHNRCWRAEFCPCDCHKERP